MISIKFVIQRCIFRLYLMISIFFQMGTPAKIPPFCICLIFWKCPRGTKWHSFVLRSGGLIEIIPLKKNLVYTTFRFYPVAPGLYIIQIKNQNLFNTHYWNNLKKGNTNTVCLSTGCPSKTIDITEKEKQWPRLHKKWTEKICLK